MEKPVSPTYFNFESDLLGIVRSVWDLPFDNRLYPFLIDPQDCCLLEVRSRTSRKAVLRAAGQSYFLKQVPWYAADRAQAATITECQHQVARRGSLSKSPVQTRQGAYFAQVKNDLFYLTPVFPGNVSQDWDADAPRAAQALARLHDLTIKLPAARNQNYFDLVQDLLGVIWARPGMSGTLVDVYLLLETELNKARADAQQLGSTQICAVHGDFSPWNILYGAGKASDICIVDFDNCDMGWPQRDLAELILTHAAIRYQDDTTEFAQPFHVEINPARASAIMRTYVQARSSVWAYNDQQLLHPVMCALLVEYIALGLLRGEINGGRDGVAIHTAFRVVSDLTKGSLVVS